MTTQEMLNLIKDSFEVWYNERFVKDESPMTIVINYNDVQTLRIKAYHTITMEVQAVGIRDNSSFTLPLLKLQENYNHGVTSEDEAKIGLTKKMLVEMFRYQQKTA